MQKRIDIPSQWRSPKAAMGALMLGLFVFLHVLAVSETLHQCFHHHDSGNPEDGCVVALLAHGQVDAVSVDVPLPSIAAYETLVAHTVETFVGYPVYRLLPGRAPPACPLA